MRLVEQVEEHGGMVLIAGGGVFPKVGVLLPRCFQTVQVEQQIRAAICDEIHDIIDQFTVGRAVVPRAFASPEFLIHRQADEVRFPLVGRHQRGLHHLLTARAPFEAYDVHALQPHRPAILGQHLISRDMQLLRPLLAPGPFHGHAQGL